MTWTSLDTWIVVAGVLSAMACALLGNFLLVRRMSMMGDAISHAVLPGLAAAFLLTGSRGSLPMFAGAVAVGVLTALLTQWISHFGKVEESAAMGVVFTSLFALGLVMIVRAADAVDLDPGCVLYGAIELTPLDTVALGGWEVPRAVVTTGGVFLLNALVVGLLYKEFKISAFDPELATTLGFSARFLHYLLMVLVAVTTVACFESVGSILVIAMLIVPAAAARLLTGRLFRMIGVSLAIAAACGVLGHLSAITVPGWFGFADTSTAGMMAVVAGVLFLAALFFAPQQGMVSRWWHRAALGVRVAAEDVLGMLFRHEEAARGARVPAATLRHEIAVAPWLHGLAMRQLLRRGFIEADGGLVALTAAGRDAAGSLIRSHRLWERYLADHVNVRPDHVHGSSEQLEHITSPAMQQTLAEGVDDRARDPHGHAIPGSTSADVSTRPEP